MPVEEEESIAYRAPIASQGAGMAPGRGIDNIFSALAYERTSGAIAEFTLWCVVCLVVVLSLMAAIMGRGTVTWILLMTFAIGLAVLMAFRLKPISLLCSVGCFQLITTIVHYTIYALEARDTKDRFMDWYGEEISVSALNIVLFVLIVLLSCAIVTCGFIHFFSSVDLGSILTVMVIVDSSLTVILQILMYAAGFLGDDASSANENLRIYLNDRSYWVGTISYWIMLVVVTLFYIFFFWGCIDSRKGKIIQVRQGGGMQSQIVQQNVADNPGIRGVSGVLAGQTIYLMGRTITIGKEPGMTVVIQDPYVSGKHCAIRFNNMNGFYEVYDISRNGVFLNGGNRLPKGVYQSVQRGSIIAIGSKEQQLMLL
jgi:hypothetical protein